MRLIGCSTGAIALGDYREGLNMLTSKQVKAAEISALRVTCSPKTGPS